MVRVRVEISCTWATEKFLITVPVHLACRRVGLDDPILRVSDDQSITGSLKNATILCFPLTQLLLCPLTLADITDDRQSMGLTLVGEGGTMNLNRERCAIFAQVNGPARELAPHLDRVPKLRRKRVGIRVDNGDAR